MSEPAKTLEVGKFDALFTKTIAQVLCYFTVVGSGVVDAVTKNS
jgi:hypothetical protein